MIRPLYWQAKFRTTNEPKVHSLVRRSFAFVPSAGMRLAPEILVLELMREVFFETHYGVTTATRNLDPDEINGERGFRFTDNQRAVLYALKGRRKKSRHSQVQRFFAPAYPCLAESGWLGKNRERVIYNFLLSGPIAQYLWSQGPDIDDGKRKQEKLVSAIIDALLGKKSCLESSFSGQDILAATLGTEGFDLDRTLADKNVKDKTGHTEIVMRSSQDELATRIACDFLAICGIEGEIPRMQWLQLLMTFLRFALPIWMLAQMQTTSLIHGWLLEAMDNGRIVDTTKIDAELSSRNKGLLHPTLTATRELFEHIERYMKCRIEVNMLLYLLEEAAPEKISSKKLARGGAGSGILTLEGLLLLARDAASKIRDSAHFREIANGLNFKAFLTREGAQFSAWRDPLMKGQGKNIDEFFRVLYQAETGDEEGGYLLAPEGRGAKRGFRVFPGQLLLKAATYLAAQDKRSCQLRGGAGKLVLQDVEELFGQYGIDFSTAADARPLLMNELKAMGLLTGSPDAGSSVAVACPY